MEKTPDTGTIHGITNKIGGALMLLLTLALTQPQPAIQPEIKNISKDTTSIYMRLFNRPPKPNLTGCRRVGNQIRCYTENDQTPAKPNTI